MNWPKSSRGEIKGVSGLNAEKIAAAHGFDWQQFYDDPEAVVEK